MARDKERDRITRHAYYLAHREDFKRRRNAWAAKNRHQIKVARGLDISVREAGALLRQQSIQPSA